MPIVTNINLNAKNATSSLKKYFMCDYCNIAYSLKRELVIHMKKKSCQIGLTCAWCNITFENRGNLALHAHHMHGDNSYRLRQPSDYVKCQVCDITFPEKYKLTYHIRQHHFNLQAKTPYCELKKVNQVWFEKVQNSNVVIEIKKTGHNKLRMRKLGPNTAIKVTDNNTEMVDLSDMYPSKPALKKRICRECNKTFLRSDFNKHVREFHNNKKGIKHRCNNCNAIFRRTNAYIKHVCHKKKFIRGVKGYSKDLIITSVESLSHEDSK